MLTVKYATVEQAYFQFQMSTEMSMRISVSQSDGGRLFHTSGAAKEKALVRQFTLGL